ncbi:PVC-type heme-binding CxxCH protein [Planctomicrobium sp. SH664]|uniref:PVC-type heme-binding CxxCH protein n=1 Tax=Planctomicrobium sp. SH664 TaxID=3448125 RepID=UPI003F5C9C8C
MSLRHRSLGLLLVLICGSANSLSAEEKNLKPRLSSTAFHQQALLESEGRSWKPLLNGQDLTGWKVVLRGHPVGEDPEKIFQVVDGDLHLFKETPPGKEMPFGVLLSDESYSHYRFRFDYRWGEKKFAPRQERQRDAGLLMHVVGPEKVWPMSFECQLQEGDTGDLFFVYTGGDAPVDENQKADLTNGVWSPVMSEQRVMRVVKESTAEKEGWNSVEVIVRGDSALFIVNGVVNNYTVNLRAPIGPDNAVVPLTEGRLALQCEGAEIFYRNPEILILDPPAASPSTSMVPQDSQSPSADVEVDGPLSPEKGTAAWKVREGMKVELVAAEPLLMDPVAIDWGLDGKLWVVEMADYPLGLDGRGKPGGRARFLEKSRPDGPYDRSTLFLKDLSFPTGIVAWNKGVIITAAPEIFYAEDSNGDGVCDVKQVLFSGFHQGNQQLRINGLRWGLDGWLHCASGSHRAGYGAESRIYSHVAKKFIELGSKDFRFHPVTGELEPLAGPSQFGRNRDDWDNWFGVQNSYPLWHYLFEDRYLRRNPHLAAPDPREILSERNPRVFPAAEIGAQFNPRTQVGRFTSACSGMVYGDHLLALDPSCAHAFTCEPVHNLVQHNLLTRSGATFSMQRDVAGEEVDFLASTDAWCRPVMVRTGPDGALWVVDMYRKVIEHPEFVPEGLREEMLRELRLGEDRGRLYRVLPADGEPRPVPDLIKLDLDELVLCLDHPNSWVRESAQRRLVEMDDAAAVPAIKVLLKFATTPQGRLHALYALANRNRLLPRDLIDVLHDPHEELRRHALRLAERSGHLDDVNVLAAVVELVDDPSEIVRLQLAFTLGESRQPLAQQGIVRLWGLPSLTPHLETALLSSLNPENVSAVMEVVSAKPLDTAHARDLYRQVVSQAVAMGKLEHVAAALENHPRSRGDLIRALIAVEAIAQQSSLSSRLGELNPKSLGDLRQQVAVLAESDEAEAWLRVLAISFLLHPRDENPLDSEFLLELLTTNTPASLRVAVVRSLGQRKDLAAGQILLESWPRLLPNLKMEVLETLVNRPEWHGLMADALERQSLRSGEIPLTLQEQLVANKASPHAARFLSQFESQRVDDGGAATQALQLSGDRARGRAAFQKHCTECHRYEAEGALVGPNLSSVTGRTPDRLLEAILDPNKAVEPMYFNYVVSLTDGRALSGLVVNESEQSLTLLKAKGEKVDVLRSEIDELRSSGKSLMPEGFSRILSPQDLADLIAYLRQDATVGASE